MDRLFHRVYNFIVRNSINLALAVALLSFAFVLWIRCVMVFYQFPDIGGIEQNVVYDIQRILAGFKLYVNPELPPYSITQYPPLYYYICAFAGKVFNVNPDRQFDVFILSRSISLLFNISLLGVSFFMIKGIFKVDGKAAIVACVFIFLYLERNIYSRPDSLYSLLFMVTICLFIFFLKASSANKRLFFLLLSSISIALTIYSKQSGILLPAIILFFLIFYVNNIKEVIISSSSMTAAFLILLFFASGDNLNVFFQNVYKGISNGIDPIFFYKAIVKPYFRGVLIWNILGFTTALYLLKKDSELSLKFLSISIFAAYIFAFITGFKQGSTPSYFTEHMNLVFITLTIFLFSGNRYFNTDYPRIAHFLTVLFFLPYLAISHYDLYEHFYTNYAPEAYERSEKVYRYLSEDNNLNSSELVLVTGENYTERRFLDNFLYKNNIMPQKKIINYDKDSLPVNSPFDYSHLTKNINNGLIKYLVLNKETGKKKYMGVDLTNFKHIKDTDDYSIYEYSNIDIQIE